MAYISLKSAQLVGRSLRTAPCPSRTLAEGAVSVRLYVAQARPVQSECRLRSPSAGSSTARVNTLFERSSADSTDGLSAGDVESRSVALEASIRTELRAFPQGSTLPGATPPRTWNEEWNGEGKGVPNEVRQTGGSLPARHRPARSGGSVCRLGEKRQEGERGTGGGGVERRGAKRWNGGGCVSVPSWFGRWFGTPDLSHRGQSTPRSAAAALRRTGSPSLPTT